MEISQPDATMPPARWQRIVELADEAHNLPPAQRAKFLDDACADDSDLRQHVEALLEQFSSPSPARELSQTGVTLSAEALIDDLIDAYRVKRVIGRGGMGIVYLAVRDDDAYQKRVSIKLLKPGMDSEEILQRFRHERQTLAVLDHPGIARLLDGGTTKDGRPYFVMEYIDGVPIDAYCDRHRLNVSDRIKLFREVCEAISYAHQNLIVHRDLKPSNILVTAEGRPKLLDFGIAKLLNPEMSSETIAITRTEMRMMTPEYASPEQVRGEPITTASDVYSLGVLLYRLLTGERPYRLTSYARHEMERVICEVNPERPSTAVSRVQKPSAKLDQSLARPEAAIKTRKGHAERLRRRLAGDLDNILLMALRKEPHRRYSSVEQFSEDLHRHLKGMPVRARKDTFSYRASRFIARNKFSVAAATLFAILIVGFAVITKQQSERIALERDKAQHVSAFLVDLFGVADPGTAKGNTITAREILDRGAAKVENDLHNQPEIQAALLSTIGEVYQKLGLYDEAAPALQKALDVRRQLYGEVHPEVAASIDNLATVYWNQGDYEAAEELLRQALAMRRALFGNEHLAVAESMNNLSVILATQRNYHEAEPLMREALAMRRKLLGKEHPAVSEGLNNLANVLQNMGNYEEAEKLYRECLKLDRKLLGDEHPDLAVSLNNLASLLESRGKREEAKKLFHESLEMRRKLLGENHPDVATVLNNLAGLQEDAETAVRLYREALSIRRKALGERHPLVASTLSNLGILMQYQGDYASAESLQTQAVAIDREVYGERHTSFALRLCQLAELKLLQGNLAEAMSLANQAVGIQQAVLTPDHWRLAYAKSVYGSCLTAQGKYSEAEPLLVDGFDRAKRELGEGDMRAQLALRRVINLYESWGKSETAAEFRAHLTQ